MYCDNPRAKSIDSVNRIGCCWSIGYGHNRWGNYPRYDETFAGDYQNMPVKDDKEELFFTSLAPIYRSSDIIRKDVV